MSLDSKLLVVAFSALCSVDGQNLQLWQGPSMLFTSADTRFRRVEGKSRLCSSVSIFPTRLNRRSRSAFACGNVRRTHANLDSLPNLSLEVSPGILMFDISRRSRYLVLEGRLRRHLVQKSGQRLLLTDLSQAGLVLLRAAVPLYFVDSSASYGEITVAHRAEGKCLAFLARLQAELNPVRLPFSQSACHFPSKFFYFRTVFLRGGKSD